MEPVDWKFTVARYRHIYFSWLTCSPWCVERFLLEKICMLLCSLPWHLGPFCLTKIVECPKCPLSARFLFGDNPATQGARCGMCGQQCFWSRSHEGKSFGNLLVAIIFCGKVCWRWVFPWVSWLIPGQPQDGSSWRDMVPQQKTERKQAARDVD